MGKQVEINEPYTNVWLYADGVFSAGDVTTLTDAEWSALSTVTQGFVTVLDAGATDPVRDTPVVAGPSTAAEMPLVPSGGVSAIDVQNAVEELDADKQPLDPALTSISGLSVTPYGLSLLTLADQDALRTEAAPEV